MVSFGALVELAWMRASRKDWQWPDLPRRRVTPVLATIALCSVLASVQLAAPFNPVAGAERSVVLAAVGLAFTAWGGLAPAGWFVAPPGPLPLPQVFLP